MVALDSAARAPSRIRLNLAATLIAGGLLGGLCAGAAPLEFLGRTDEGWSLAARTTDEFAGLLFLIAFLAAPLARLFPRSLGKDWQHDRRRLTLGFVASYAVCLTTAIFAMAAQDQRLGAPQAAGMAFQFLMLVALVATSDLWPALGARPWQRVHTGALWFFWLAYTFAYLGHFVGPHVPDSSFAVGLALLLAGLLIRFAATLKAVWIAPLAEKVG
jgi:sulfoxide reductase heme-binding subunit YedZ